MGTTYRVVPSSSLKPRQRVCNMFSLASSAEQEIAARLAGESADLFDPYLPDEGDAKQWPFAVVEVKRRAKARLAGSVKP